MNVHGLIDHLALIGGARFLPKYFRDGYQSPPFSAHLAEVELSRPPREMQEEHEEVKARTLVGELEGGLRRVQWKGAAYPTVIYHHGANEIPCDYGFSRIFPLQRQDIAANFYLVRAPFHRSVKEFMSGIRTLSNFVAMLAVSVRIIQEVVQDNLQQGVPVIAVAGTSLGGFITNLHHIHFDSAQVYTPLLAGLVANDAFLRSAYSRATAPVALNHPQDIERVLDFSPGFAAAEHTRVFPLLALYDQIIRFGPHRESYGDCPVEVIKRGHTTGALSYALLRRHVLQCLQSAEQAGAGLAAPGAQPR